MPIHDPSDHPTVSPKLQRPPQQRYEFLHGLHLDLVLCGLCTFLVATVPWLAYVKRKPKLSYESVMIQSLLIHHRLKRKKEASSNIAPEDPDNQPMPKSFQRMMESIEEMNKSLEERMKEREARKQEIKERKENYKNTKKNKSNEEGKMYLLICILSCLGIFFSFKWELSSLLK